jgi:serine-type D-Ala-D-Ala carboxypeptidase
VRREEIEGHVKLYAPLLEGLDVGRAEALALAASARRAGCEGAPPPEGFPPVYSDLGYLLLGEAITARAGAPLDEVIRREVSDPLDLVIGSARQMRARSSLEARGEGGERARFDERVAPTEDVPFRGGVVRGVVHDENAFAITRNATAGHAGLFGDARSVARLGVAILDALAGRAPGWLDPDDLTPLVRPRPGGSLLAGFDRRSGEAPLSGARFGPQTFGHLGFTGTSLWMDPEAERVGVLLTNRVHPTRESQAIRKARPAVYDALVEAMG